MGFVQGWTFTFHLFASLYFGMVLTESCRAFSYYPVFLFLYRASIPGCTNNNAIHEQNPAR